jgi:hypothetical protein
MIGERQITVDETEGDIGVDVDPLLWYGLGSALHL